MRGAGVFGKSQPGVWVYREGVAPPLRYESPPALALAQSQWGRWGWSAGVGGPRGRDASCWLSQEPLPW